jgi:hypothetical protein
MAQRAQDTAISIIIASVSVNGLYINQLLGRFGRHFY